MKRRPDWSVRAGVVLLTISSAAWGGAPNYNYLDAAWLKIKPDDATVAQADGYRLLLSAPLDEGNFLRASYGRIETDDKARASLTTVGLGSFTRLQAGTDFYGLLSYEEIDDKAAAGDKGLSLELGLRWSAGRRLQLDLGGRYVKLDRRSDETQWFGEAQFHLIPGFALSGRYTLGETDTRYSIGLRAFQR